MPGEEIWREKRVGENLSHYQLPNLMSFVLLFYNFVALSAAQSFLSSPTLTSDRIDFDNTVFAPDDLLGVLYPESTESRKVLSLDGSWDFRLAPEFDPDAGFRDEWYAQPLKKAGEVIDVKVPGSYEELFNQWAHIYPGWAWYKKTFNIPQTWTTEKRKIFVRISAAHYYTVVYVNGMEIMRHEGGSAAFVTELPISACVEAGGQCGDEGTGQRITLAINNTLTLDTIPQGEWRIHQLHRRRQNVTRLWTDYLFMRYAGIVDSVLVYSTPPTFISDVTVATDSVDSNGVAYLRYSVLALSPSGKQCMDSVAVKGEESCRFTVQLLDKNGATVASATESSGILTVKDAKLWWPFTTVQNQGDVGYLYKFQVSLTDFSYGTMDVYAMNFGIRTIQWTDTNFLINNKPFYFRGIAEPPAEALSDTQYYCGNNAANCSRQRFANAIAKFGQPLTEGMLELADKLGVVVIVQAPAINLRNYSGLLLENHKKEMRELIQQTKNHASVVLWSMAKRPNLGSAKAHDYFRELADFVRSVDLQRRPVTLSVTVADLDSHSLHTDYLDVVSLIYYTAQHDTPASRYTEVIGLDGMNNAMLGIVERSWKEMKKPIIIADYGILQDSRGVCEGKESERETFRRLQKEFDYLYSKGLITGEMNWSCDQYYGRGSSSSSYGEMDSLLYLKALGDRYAALAGAHSQ